jgi:hypothetical protein
LAVSEDRNPLESALDVFVYAPLGLFFTVTEEMPSWSRRAGNA